MADGNTNNGLGADANRLVSGAEAAVAPVATAAIQGTGGGLIVQGLDRQQAGASFGPPETVIGTEQANALLPALTSAEQQINQALGLAPDDQAQPKMLAAAKNLALTVSAQGGTFADALQAIATVSQSAVAGANTFGQDPATAITTALERVTQGLEANATQSQTAMTDSGQSSACAAPEATLQAATAGAPVVQPGQGAAIAA